MEQQWTLGRRQVRWSLGLAALAAALTACAPQTNLSMTGNVPEQYSHVWLTVQEVWFNTSATAVPADSTWVKLPLSTPITVDLASLTNGTLAQIATQLKVPTGTYAQIRLFPVDPFAPLTSSASSAGAQFNAEADYIDGTGVAHVSPLELLNPEVGIGINTTLTITSSTGFSIGAPSTTGTTAALVNTPTIGSGTTTGTTTGMYGGTTGTTTVPTFGGGTATIPTTFGGSTTGTTTTGGTTLTSGTTTTSTTSSGTTKTVTIGTVLSGFTDLVQFTYGTQTGIMLNPHVVAADVSSSGTIRGTLDLSPVPGSVDASGHVNIQVTAEGVSSDGSRHTAVMTVPVRSDGTFVLYPLPVLTGSNSTYDLVVSGPQVATVIIKGVPVSAGDPNSASAVSVGTVSLRSTTAFTFNVSPSTLPVSAGTIVTLYQTLPGSTEIPYVVSVSPVDPFNRTLITNQSVSAGTVDFGNYVSGGNVSLTTTTPQQGAGTYAAAAQAPLFSDSSLNTPLSASGGASSTPVVITLPALQPAAGGSSSSIAVAVAAATPGKYDHGQLIVSQNGAVVQTVPIDNVLTQPGPVSVLVQRLPGGIAASNFNNAVYYLSVRSWHSRDPAGTLTRQTYPIAVDLRAGSVTGLSITVD
jgi:hypothetical protein